MNFNDYHRVFANRSGDLTFLSIRDVWLNTSKHVPEKLSSNTRKISQECLSTIFGS